MRATRVVIGAVGTVACVVVGASVAFGANASTAPAGGPIQIFVQPGQGQGKGKILVTGAVGDYGTTSPSTGTGGKKFGTAKLKKGTIKIELTAISAKVAKAKPTVNAATCSGSLTATAQAPVVSGTGLYAGIHGSIRITESFGFLGSTYRSGAKKGQCNMSNSAPTVASFGTVYGKGSVSF